MSYITIVLCSLFLLPRAEQNSNQQHFLATFVQDLTIKHFLFVTDSFNKHDRSHFIFAKHLSKLNIFFQQFEIQHFNLSMEYQAVRKCYNRKTVVLLSGDDFFDLFDEENEVFLSLYTWTVFRSVSDILQKSENMYIPYNCQFIVIDSEDGKNFYMSEVYDVRFAVRKLYTRYFGFWSKNTGLELVSSDFYQRRFHMNGTWITVIAEYWPSRCPLKGLCAYEEMIKEMGRMMNFQ